MFVQQVQQIRKAGFLKYALLAIFVLVCAIPLAAFPDYDWRENFYPAAQVFLHGQSPYNTGFANPIWTMLFVVPISLFPMDYSRGLVGVLTLLASTWLCWKYKMSVPGTALFLLSGTVFGNFHAGNLDALVLLGLYVPAEWSLFVLMVKPQIGLGYALWRGVKSWHERTLIKIIVPFLIAFIGCMIIYPDWLPATDKIRIYNWNCSLFPYAIPLGLFLLWQAVRKDKPSLALAASAFLSPYLTLYSYVTVQVALMDSKSKWRDWWMLIFFIASWAFQLMFGRG